MRYKDTDIATLESMLKFYEKTIDRYINLFGEAEARVIFHESFNIYDQLKCELFLRLREKVM